MKKLLPLLLLLPLLCACVAEDTAATTGAFLVEQLPTTEATEPDVTTAPTQVAQATVPTPQVVEPYTLKITRADFPIYAQPDYSAERAGVVGEVGVFTIVEEFTDAQGNLWGKLRSGAGWVDISLLEREKASVPQLTVGRAGSSLLDSGNYHYCVDDSASPEYSYPIYLQTDGTLYNVCFFRILTLDGPAREHDLIRIPQWHPEKGLVAMISFPGWSVSYGLQCTDSAGVTRIYEIVESGKDGSVQIHPLDIWLPPPAEEIVAMPEKIGMYFGSGVGGWGTELTLRADGSFTGKYYESNLMDNAPDYPNGTYYICEFEGKFQIAGTSEYSLTLELAELKTAQYPEGEWIEDGVRYIASDATGIAGEETFRLYMPFTPVDALPEGVLSWRNFAGHTTAECYVLVGEHNNCPFFG